MVGKVVMFKTAMGIEYIGEIVKEDAEVYQVKNLYAMVPHQAAGGEVTVSLGAAIHPSLGKLSNTNHGAIDVDLRKDVVVFTYEPATSLLATYTEASGGIQIVKTMPGKLMK